MDFLKLQKNIIDVITEEQIKLGYCKETIRLYYPIQSLNRFLGADYGVAEMAEALDNFSAYSLECLGGVEISHKNSRFCILIPPKGVELVYKNRGDVSFISDFIAVIGRHGATIDGIVNVFKKYSDAVHVEKVNHGEFDYLIYFEDGVPDDYRYCITNEECHLIYHRYTKEDYEDLEL